MSRTYKIILSLVVVMVVAYAGWHFYQARRARQAGILSENIQHNGNDWISDFTATIPAPEGQVYDAVRDIEKTHSDQLHDLHVVSQADNAKTIDFLMQGPGGQDLKGEMVFQYDPAARTISYQTTDNSDLKMSGNYKFEDQGGSTIITSHQVTTIAQQLPVPEGVVKEVIHQIAVSQLEGLKRTLNIASSDESEEEEP